MADSSLDDMLLEAAGRTKNRDPHQPYRPVKRRGAAAALPDYSSDEPSSEDEDNHDFDSDSDGGMRSRIRGGSSMPLKKRFETTDREDDDEEEEQEDEDGDGQESSDLSYGSDLYKDDADRERLAAMSELQREMILSERAEKRDNFLMRKKAEARRQEAQSNERPPSSRVRSSTSKPPSAKSVKENALHELVAKRQRAQDAGSKRRRNASPPTRERELTPSDSEGEEDLREESPDRSHSEEREDDIIDDIKPTFDAIKSITIPRSKLAKWFLEPFFEDIIVGCFVRIAFGLFSQHRLVYRLYQVKSVDVLSEPYKFANRVTYKYLNCARADSSACSRWKLLEVSDHAPESIEFTEWEKKLQSGTEVMTSMEIVEKQEAIAKLGSFVYSAATVKQMLMEKKLATSRPSNIAAEKNRLTKELGIAENEENDEEVERIKTRLKELESLELEMKAKDAKALALAEMNKKNRFENFVNASKAKPAALVGQAGYDPFSRRWTRSRNYYRGDDVKQIVEPAKNEEEENREEMQQGKLMDTQAPVDQKTQMFHLHNFDLPISLDGIQKYGGGASGAPLAFIARKQKLEATCGAKVLSNDSGGHTKTLTVNDYKRRRGLL